MVEVSDIFNKRAISGVRDEPFNSHALHPLKQVTGDLLVHVAARRSAMRCSLGWHDRSQVGSVGGVVVASRHCGGVVCRCGSGWCWGSV